jgi:DNA-binding transcriptional ArsR family regulator
MHIDRRPPTPEDLRQILSARIARDGRRTDTPVPIHDGKQAERRQCSLRSCHLPAERKARLPAPRDSGAYVPEMAARIDDDPNLTDGARRCARKLAEYVYRKNRSGRTAEITVTWLMRALGKSRRSVQRYLEELERGGYINADVLYAGTRMCVGLFIELLAPLFPRHHRQKWPQKRMDSDAPELSQKYRFRLKTGRISRRLWALRCMDGVFRSFMKTLPPFPPYLITV